MSCFICKTSYLVVLVMGRKLKNHSSMQQPVDASARRTPAKCLSCNSIVTNNDPREFSTLDPFELFQPPYPQEDPLRVWSSGGDLANSSMHSTTSLPSFNPSNFRHNLDMHKGWG
jgi:hypothetical protein